jgi:hypothetical protein
LQDRIRTRHNEWGKGALALWLKELGDVQLDVRIGGESGCGDVLSTERRSRGDRRHEREFTMNWEKAYERWERKVKAEGKAEGKAEAVLAVLEGRGLTITAAQRRQVLACTDNAVLNAWLRAAGTTPSVRGALPRALDRHQPRS